MIWQVMQHLFVALITGSGGYLGGHVVETFLAGGYHTILVVRQDSLLSNEKVIQSWKESYPNTLEVIECDLSIPGISLEKCYLNSNITVSLRDISCIINCASPFIRSCSNPMEVIVEPTVNIAENIMHFAAAARRSQLNNIENNNMENNEEKRSGRNLRVVHVSSSAALRGPGQKPYLSASSKPYTDPSDSDLSTSAINNLGKMFSPKDWNTCSQINGSGMQPYQFAKTISEQIIFERGLENNIDVVSIIPVTMLGPICNAQEFQLKLHEKEKGDDYEKGGDREKISEITQGVTNIAGITEGEREGRGGREDEGGGGRNGDGSGGESRRGGGLGNNGGGSGGGVSAQFIKDWHSHALKHENRLIADVRDVSNAILRAAQIELKKIDSNFKLEKSKDLYHEKCGKNSENSENGEYEENKENKEIGENEKNRNPPLSSSGSIDKSVLKNLQLSSVRNRMFHIRRYIIGRSRRVEHSAVENVLQFHGYSGGSVIITEKTMRVNALFRTDIDEIDTSTTGSGLEGGLGVKLRSWEETILDTARQYYNR